MCIATARIGRSFVTVNFEACACGCRNPSGRLAQIILTSSRHV